MLKLGPVSSSYHLDLMSYHMPIAIAIGFMILTAFLYQILIRPYLQYRYYLQQAKQNPNLFIHMPSKFVPLFGDLLRLHKAIKLNDDHLFLEREAIQNRARFSVAFLGCIIRIDLLDADVVQEVLSASMFDWTGVPRISSMILNVMIPNSLIAMEGQPWHTRRKLVIPIFRYQMMKVYADAISNVAQELFQHAPSSESEIDLSRMFKRWTIAVIGACAFGGAFNNRDESDIKLTDEAIQSLTDLLYLSAEFATNPINLIPGMTWFPTPARYKFQSVVRRCHRVTNAVIQRRLQGQKPTIDCERDLLDVLLSSQPDTGKPLSTDDIRDECLLFIFAGHDTTANLLSWLLVVFYQYPDIEQKCREEVLDALRSNDSSFPTETDVKSMPFLHACFLETLRLYPPAPVIARESRRPMNLGGLQVQSGTMLRIDVWAIHHSPRYWKDPEIFNPHRFLSQDNDGNLIVHHPSDVHTHAWIPFSNGLRACPGQGFAQLEARIMMAGLLFKFNFEFSPGQKFPEKIKLTSGPKYGVMGRLIPRFTNSGD